MAALGELLSHQKEEPGKVNLHLGHGAFLIVTFPLLVLN